MKTFRDILNEVKHLYCTRVGKFLVVTWRDPYNRSYVTQLKDEDGNVVKLKDKDGNQADADYSMTRSGALFNQTKVENIAKSME